MKTLVLAEKPSVGRDIARVLGCAQKLNGGLEGKDYVVTWGLGHLVTLQDPEGYDGRYREWKMEDLPMLPERLRTSVIRQTAKQFQAVKGLVHRKDIEGVIIATDAGREGELVARWILEEARNDKPCRRLWISSVTDKAIRQGFASLKEAKAYEPLYAAALSRAEADWLVGINATRALTCKYNAQLSCGRVQTPTLAMIAARDEQIRAFKPKTYYSLGVSVEGVTFGWRDKKSGSGQTFDEARAKELTAEFKGAPLTIRSVKEKEKQLPAPQLYDLTTLQQDANRKYGFSAKETLNLMQRLYENHKVLTYPRTDSRYLTADLADTLGERLQACGAGPYRKLAAPLAKTVFTAKHPVFCDQRVGDHHAIIPTEQYVDLLHMTAEERKIYDLVVRRFLAALYPPAVQRETVLEGEIAGETVTARIKVMVSPGWREVYVADKGSLWEDEEEEETFLGGSRKEGTAIGWKQGDILRGAQPVIREGKTKPPARFTEGTLLAAMEHPAAFMESQDKRLVKTLGETGGLGTVATRADIIDKLFSSFLLEKKGQEIYLTAKAKQLLELVPAELKSPELTARWELRLSEIAGGKAGRKEFMQDIREYTVKLIDEIRRGEGTFRHENRTTKKCPQCGKFLLKVKGKQAMLLVCEDRACGYRETLSRTTNARCPVCHKKMEMVGKGEGSMFVCSCGHKERLEKFQERRQKEGKGVSKRDVNAYLKKQEKEAGQPLNNAFARALEGIKLD